MGGVLGDLGATSTSTPISTPTPTPTATSNATPTPISNAASTATLERTMNEEDGGHLRASLRLSIQIQSEGRLRGGAGVGWFA